ncbi:molybdopterin converting factor subunit 1 [Niallia sp. Man26]|uniref:molybdopterin converting factor subunit 1 n=1 Tax=Niallia sp. Man26 TaxID=2912824 RepID=UPI001EDAB74A|nr:molybdopterin converting factor subunit 1 [Niallia sp. Man26]UPO87512.1 molybdopterin converting factor subunit 1 [Niallia sp. Man26]
MNKLLFFAGLKDIVKADQLELDMVGKTVKEVKAELAQQYSDLPLESVMTAINEEFAFDDDIIEENDVIAFIPPVSGG